MQVKIQVPAFQKLFIRLAMVCVLMGSSLIALKAQNNPYTFPGKVKYVGVADGKLLFQLDYANETTGNVNVEITDRQGYQFYFESIKSKKFTKQFAIEKADMVNNSITFAIRHQNEIRKYKFDISTGNGGHGF